MTTPPAPAHLESAIRKLREGAATASQGLIPPRIYADECAALLTRLEALEADIAFARQCLLGQYESGPECDCEYGHSCGWPKFRDFMQRGNPAPAAEGE